MNVKRSTTESKAKSSVNPATSECTNVYEILAHALFPPYCLQQLYLKLLMRKLVCWIETCSTRLTSDCSIFPYVRNKREKLQNTITGCCYVNIYLTRAQLLKIHFKIFKVTNIHIGVKEIPVIWQKWFLLCRHLKRWFTSENKDRAENQHLSYLEMFIKSLTGRQTLTFIINKSWNRNGAQWNQLPISPIILSYTLVHTKART